MGSRERRPGSMDARGIGDAVWVMPRTDVITPPARKGLLEVFGLEVVTTACEQAVADFRQPGGPYQDPEALARAQQVLDDIYDREVIAKSDL
jgi:hypothetical protein